MSNTKPTDRREWYEIFVYWMRTRERGGVSTASDMNEVCAEVKRLRLLGYGIDPSQTIVVERRIVEAVPESEYTR